MKKRDNKGEKREREKQRKKDNKREKREIE